MKLTLSIFALFVCTLSLACNSCGCFIGSGINGINLQNSKWLFRYNSQLRSFNTLHPIDEIYRQQRHTEESFWQHSINASRAIKPWLFVSVNASFSNNSFTENEATQHFNGFGNFGFGVGVQKVIYTQDNGNNAFWISQANLAIPTGKYKGNSPNNDFSESIYPSTGALGSSIATQFVYNSKRNVYFLQGNAILNGESRNNYRFGTGINASLGMLSDVIKLGGIKTLAVGAELAYYKTFQNQYYGKALPDNNGSYSLSNIHLGYKSEAFNLFVKQAFILSQNIGSGFTQLNNQTEITLTIKI